MFVPHNCIEYLTTVIHRLVIWLAKSPFNQFFIKRPVTFRIILKRKIRGSDNPK